MSVLDKWTIVQKNIKEACQKSGRKSEEVQVVAVTKYVSVTRMNEALSVGLEQFGESRAQDALPKWNDIGNKAVWHFIGHLQTNKVRDIIDKFDYIHSLDRPSLAKELNKRAASLDKPISCFVQVNVAKEESKHGLAVTQVEDFVESMQHYPFLNIIGLMTMAPFLENPEETRAYFRELKQIQLSLQKKEWDFAPLTELSMGMSNDYQIAIEEGATVIRLGSCLVG